MRYFLDKDGYLRYTHSGELVHLLEAEKKLGRKLKPWEHVVHVTPDKCNNDPHNLYISKNIRHEKALMMIERLALVA